MAEILKEFLVSLGFATDETSFKKFNDGVEKVTKTTIELGAVAAGTATALGKAIITISDHMEDLYYISQRTGSTVENIQAAQYGFSQIGLKAGDATAALENFASALRTNPGNSALLNALGVDTKDKITGQARDTEEVFNDLIKNLKGKPFYLAKQYAAQFGIDDKTLLMLEQGYDKAMAAEDQFREHQRAAGVHPQALAESSKELGNALETLQSDIGLTGEKLEQYFVKPMTRAVNEVDKLVQEFNHLDDKTVSISVSLAAAGTALAGFLGVKGVLSALGIGGKSAAVKEVEAVAAAAETAGTKISSTAGLLRGLLGIGAAGYAATKIEGALDDATGVTAERDAAKKRIEQQAGEKEPPVFTTDWFKFWWKHSSSSKAAAAPIPKGAPGFAMDEPFDPRGSGNHSGFTNKVADVVEYLKQKGLSALQAAGITANAERESGLNPQATGDGGSAYGIFQLHSDRQRAFKKWAGHDIRQASIWEQIDFALYEMTQGAEKRAGQFLSAATSPEQAGAIFSRYNERPGDADGEAAIRARRAGEIFAGNGAATPGGVRPPVTVSQTTHITVTGAGDAHGTASAVESAQSRVIADMVRNMEGVVR